MNSEKENESARDRQIESSITGVDSTCNLSRCLTLMCATPLFLSFFRKVCNIDQPRHCKSLYAGPFYEHISLPTAELALAATSAATLSTSTTMKALLYRDLGNVARGYNARYRPGSGRCEMAGLADER